MKYLIVLYLSISLGCANSIPHKPVANPNYRTSYDDYNALNPMFVLNHPDVYRGELEMGTAPPPIDTN